MADTTNSSAAGQAPQELRLTRILGAPRGLVFKAWTDPEQVARWWGPRGFTNPVCELDARVGGLIRIDMRGPNGAIYPMKGLFHEVVEPERLVFTGTALEDAHAAHQACHQGLRVNSAGGNGIGGHGTGLERKPLSLGGRIGQFAQGAFRGTRNYGSAVTICK
jgi:uncharacterized protein YndB with AHSA1/START domain